MRATILQAITILAVVNTAAAQENRRAAADTLRRDPQQAVQPAQSAQVVYGDPINYAAVREQLARASRPTLLQRAADRLRRPLISASPSDNFDISGTAGIGYTQETGVAVAAAATAPFSTGGNDSLTPPSSSTLAASVSVTGFYRFRSTGNIVFPRGRGHLTWDLDLASLPMRFWGLGYEAADSNPYTRYTHKGQRATTRYTMRVAGPFHAGISLDVRHAEAAGLDAAGERYLAAQRQPHRALSTGIGITAEVDTRDNPVRATNGIYLALLAEIRPRALGDCTSTLWHITATADWYHPLWRDAVIAADLYADLWSSATPWLFWPSVGGTSRLRGYYTGRYTDRKMVSAQVELRQRIYGPIGVCIWGGAANVCASHKLFDWSEILPNCGLGMRLALGERTSLRIDYGFGRRSNGLVINVNEAF